MVVRRWSKKRFAQDQGQNKAKEKGRKMIYYLSSLRLFFNVYINFYNKFYDLNLFLIIVRDSILRFL